jgi:hypothetical protein
VSGAAWWAYDKYYAGVDTDDVGELFRIYEEKPEKRLLVWPKLRRVYRPGDYPAVAGKLDSSNPETQELAIRLLAERSQEKAVPKLVEMIRANQSEGVARELATAMERFADNKQTMQAVPRLIELTDESEPQPVRAASHKALIRLIGMKQAVKFGSAMRQQWEEVWKMERRHINM